ncbi:MAG TPA: helix-turn-helix domain-containing protein [Sphingobium sp.]
MPAPLDARMQRSRRVLRDALLALLEEKPFDQITVREITARAKVGYATFFRHYASKEALLHDLAAGQISDLLDMTVPVLFVANSLEACRALCAYVFERRTLWTALLTGGAANTVRDEFIQQARGITSRAHTKSSWLPGDLSTVWATGGCIDVLAWWLAQRESYSADQVAEIIDRLIVGPIIADAEPKEQSGRGAMIDKYAEALSVS